MISLFLNDFPEGHGNPCGAVMTPACFQHVIDLMERENDYRANLWLGRIHPDRLLRYLQLLETKKIHADVFLDAPIDNQTLSILVEKKVPLTVDAGCLTTQARDTDSHRLKEAAALNVFLPLHSTRFDPLDLKKILQSGLNIHEVVMGVAWQDRSSGPSRIVKQDYGAWSELLLALASELTRHSVSFRWLCGLPLCIFNREQLGAMAATRVKWPMATCRESLTIRPDGSLWYCPRIQGPRSIHIQKEESITALRTELDQWLMPFRGFCPVHVDACRSLHTRACGGGCLAHSLSEWQGGAGMGAQIE